MDALLREYVSQARAAVAALRRAMTDAARGAADPKSVRDSGSLFKTIEASAGFLGLSRLAALARAVTTATPAGRPSDENVSALSNVLDRIGEILDDLEQEPSSEPEGNDAALLNRLRHAAKECAKRNPSSEIGADAVRTDAERQLRILKAAWQAVDEPTRAAFVDWLEQSGYRSAASGSSAPDQTPGSPATKRGAA